jgi:hypothetical protein
LTSCIADLIVRGFAGKIAFHLKKTGLLHQLLFPKTFRSLPHRRLLLNVLRSIHILCFSVVLGGLYFNKSSEELALWATGTVLSGVSLFLVDLYGSGVVLFEIRGVSVMIKILLLIIALQLPTQAQFNLLVVVIVFSSFVSHSPRWLRHKNLLPSNWLKHLAPQEESSIKEKS